MKKRRLPRKGLVLSAAITGFLIFTTELWAASLQSPNSRAEPPIYCVPDRPIAHPGDEIKILLWLDPEFTGAVDAIEWSASVGQVQKSDGDNAAIWLFPKDDQNVSDLNPAKATANVRHETIGEFACQVEVYFVDPPVIVRGRRGPSLLSARSFLLPEQNEPEGYGLYSYFLLAAPPKSELERERYLKGLESYLLIVQPIERLERYKDPSQLNITLLPVRQDIGLDPDITEDRARELANKLLALYDYARAQVLLTDLGIPFFTSGPLLVAKKPSAAGSEVIQMELDMSHVVPKLVWDWTRIFCLIATQPSSKSEVNLRKLALNVRNVIAISAGHLPNVLDRLDDWIRVLNAKA